MATQQDIVNASKLVASARLFQEDFSAEETVRWAVETFGDGLVLQTSAGIDSSVMLKLVTSISPNVKVVFVDTGYLPKETVQYMETLRHELSLNLTVVRPKLTPEELEARHGRLWESANKEDMVLYGEITKVEPMNRALFELGATAVLSGLRGNQTSNRASMTKISYDLGSKLFKVLPILRWSKEDVSEYQKDMPKHPLASKGFTTVGDAHSSRALKPGETNERATRFNGKAQECGLHTSTVPLEQLLKMSTVSLEPLPAGYVLFTKPSCKYCKAAKALLREEGLHFVEKDITSTEALAEMQQRAPGATKVPQIFGDGMHVGGFTDLHAKLGVQDTVEMYLQRGQVTSEEPSNAESVLATKQHYDYDYEAMVALMLLNKAYQTVCILMNIRA